nr:putative drug resistance transporter [blood disease bacterium R229]
MGLQSTAMALHTALPHSHTQVLPFKESLLAMLGICFVVVLVALDQTVVGTALPTVVAELKGFDLYAWVATSYLLTSVVTVPIFGRLGDFYGRKPFVVASIVVFTLASVMCGMAGSMAFLVWSRALQGVGGGMLVGTAYACIADLFPDARVRLRWQVLLSAAFGIANAIGPTLGGWMTQALGWRSVFYVNVPFGVLGLWFAWRFLPHLRQNLHAGRIRPDWQGALLITVALGALQLCVEWLPRHGLSLPVLGWLVLSVAAFAGLWWWEQRAEQPLLPFDMVRNPALATLFVLAALSGFSMFALLFYAPLLFQGGFGMSPQQAGLVITPLVVCITLGSIINGRIVTRIPRPTVMLYAGFALLALALAGMAASSRATPQMALILLMLLAGLGLGFVLPNLTVFAQQSAGRAHLGIATALLQSLRMVGGMIGTALVGTLVSERYAAGVGDALRADGATQWLHRLADPEILIDHDAQTALLAQMQSAGHDGAALLGAARHVLVSAIHLGLIVATVVAVVGLWRVRRVPPVALHHVEPVQAAE